MQKDKTLKILHILPTFCKGGGEKLVHDICNFLSRKGHSVDILCVYRNIEQGAILEKTLDSSLTLSFITANNLNKSLGNSFLSVLTKLSYYLSILLWFIKCKKKDVYSYDIINVHMTYGAFLGTLFFLFKPKNSNCKIVETNHTDSSSINGLLGFFFKINRKFRDGIIFELKEEDFILHNKKYPHIDSVFIPIGTSKPDFLYSELNENEFKNQIVIGQVGRFNIKDRRTDRYIFLFKELHRLAGEKLIFLMYGDGSDREFIESLIIKENLSEFIILKGYTDDIASAFSSINMYVTVNVGANCGVAGLQAIWSRLPTVGIQVDDSYHDNALNDIIPNSKDPSLLASYIMGLINDPSLMSNLIDRQYKHVQESHSIESYCDKTELFYYNFFSKQ